MAYVTMAERYEIHLSAREVLALKTILGELTTKDKTQKFGLSPDQADEMGELYSKLVDVTEGG